MSLLAEVSLFPMDKTGSLSPYVAKCLKVIKASGLKYQFGPMGTCLEGEWNEVMKVVKDCVDKLQEDSDRISISIKADYKKGQESRLESKVQSVLEKME